MTMVASVSGPEMPRVQETTPGADLAGLPVERLEMMLAAGHEVRACDRVVRKVKANVVSELLKGQGTFYEYNHYPKGDVYDQEAHAQYYYHAHRKDCGEHGHFHTFLRAKGMPAGVRPVPQEGAVAWPSGENAVAHLIAISMDKRGHPTHLFTTNRWVTGETWYPAGDVLRMLDRFVIDHAYPSWPTNRWLTAMLVLFRPQIERLVLARDATIAGWLGQHPGREVFEDRELEITSIAPISVEEQIEAVEQALAAAAAAAQAPAR